MNTAPGSVAIIGASLSGHATARALRTAGFTGRLQLIGEEEHRPYDRPPLSKEYLLGELDTEDLRLEMPAEDLDADWILGERAVGLDRRFRSVRLSSGRSVAADAVVIATGSAARRPPAPVVPPGLSGVCVLRTLTDARTLRAELRPGAHLVVIGAGFIGSEVASCARRLGLEVTVLEAVPTPLERQVGPVVGQAIADLHRSAGVHLVCGVPVATVHGSQRDGTGRVRSVELADGRVFDADVVLVAVGSEPTVDWLAGSGVRFAGRDGGGGVLVDAVGRTAVEQVWAVGDCAAHPGSEQDGPARIEHWTDSRDRPAHTVAALLGSPDSPYQRAPYFWSDQYGVRIQFAGHRRETDELTVEAGSAADADLLAVWRRDDIPVAVLGMNQPKAFTRLRRGLGRAPAAAPAVPRSRP